MTLTAFSIAYCAKTNGLIGTKFAMVKVSNGIIHPMALDMSNVKVKMTLSVEWLAKDMSPFWDNTCLGIQTS